MMFRFQLGVTVLLFLPAVAMAGQPRLEMWNLACPTQSGGVGAIATRLYIDSGSPPIGAWVFGVCHPTTTTVGEFGGYGGDQKLLAEKYVEVLRNCAPVSSPNRATVLSGRRARCHLGGRGIDDRRFIQSILWFYENSPER